MTSPLSIPVLKLPHAADLPLPSYQSEGAAGLDLMAALAPGETLILQPMMRALVPTGLVFQIPQGYEGQVRPRSGLAVKSGITVLNAPGTVDADYRGEVKVALINLGVESFAVTYGMRIAQLVIAPVTLSVLVETAEVDSTARGSGGFGSTGAVTVK
ncbi:dUTP diphosphatase [Labrys okinawensis]|uniref:dUTP diphosphatase n=1 Tax=Labrys okinawensis TaxID=346911 RepID=UPI0039BC9195